jgi:hypothetical protein
MSVATFSSYVDLPFAVTAAGVHLIFTFTLPTTPNSMDMPNPWYINSNEMTMLRDRLNPNIVYMGDSQGVIAVNWTLSTSPSPAGGFVSWITLVLALLPAPSVTSDTNNVFIATKSAAQNLPNAAATHIVYNNVISTSTDVTYNGTSTYTVNTTGDYQIEANLIIIPAVGVYFGLSTPALTSPPDLYGFAYNSVGVATSQSKFSVTYPFTAGDTFSIVVSNTSGLGPQVYVAEPAINYLSIKRIPTLLT